MTKLKVRTPAELITAVPYLIGFHPADSLVIAAVKEDRLAFAARIDLPDPGLPDIEAQAPVLHLATIVAEQQPHSLAIIGYGDEDRVAPSLRLLSGALGRAGVRITDEFRVADGRYWSYLCSKPSCCPPEGRSCDPPDSLIAVEATFAGAVALASRSILEDRLAPVTGDERAAMDEADGRALSRLMELTGAKADEAVPDIDADRAIALDRVLARAGRAAVLHAERTARAGDRLSDDEVAWLGHLMTSVQVRDYAWIRSGTDDWEVSLWSDVVRRVNPERVPAPASLLAFIAWRAGMGALASIAVERALDADHTYSMAETMVATLCSAIPPSKLDGWPNPAAGPSSATTAEKPDEPEPKNAEPDRPRNAEPDRPRNAEPDRPKRAPGRKKRTTPRPGGGTAAPDSRRRTHRRV